jgi:putative transposase
VSAFEIDYGAKYLQALAKIVDDLETLLDFYRCPAEHSVHLRTINPIESTFATAAGIAMAFKLIKSPQAH